MENTNVRRELMQVGEMTLEYLIAGHGSHVVLCLHGFGREAADFEVFLPHLAEDTRLVAVNLFCHGRSQFPSHRISKEPLETSEWCELIRTLCNRLNCEKFHLVGYSMGGRMAMMLMQQMPDSIESLTLIAPDGIKINLLYRFVSDTKLGRVLYRSIIRNPNWILRIADLLKGIRILHQNIHRFVYLQLETEAKRQLVYSAWLTHRKLFPDLKRVAAHVERTGISCLLVFGKHDSIIPPRLARKFIRHFRRKPTLLLPEAGHRLLNHETIEMLAHQKLAWMRISR